MISLEDCIYCTWWTTYDAIFVLSFWN